MDVYIPTNPQYWPVVADDTTPERVLKAAQKLGDMIMQEFVGARVHLRDTFHSGVSNPRPVHDYIERNLVRAWQESETPPAPRPMAPTPVEVEQRLRAFHTAILYHQAIGMVCRFAEVEKTANQILSWARRPV